MQITSVHIRNFKSIREMEIHGIENALILVGKNNTGKTSVLDAIRAVAGSYQIQEQWKLKSGCQRAANQVDSYRNRYENQGFC